MIYREKQSLIPNSRIKRIFHIDKWALRRITLATILFFMAFIIVFDPRVFCIEWICNLLSGKWLNIIGDSIAIMYMICALFFLISYFIQVLGNSKLNVLNLKNGEIKLSEASIFNEHLDEILYFFQVSDYNVVIIEDLDRFETSDIFLKLRELNLLLNESKVIERKGERPIVFIYAIKDDMFLDSERSKFFDYITTVIPTINPSNSKDKLKGELEAKGYKDIADVDLKEMGFFINDMRLLKNIANEYQQYRERLSKDLLPQNLLAMIIFKNYYPRTFAELHRCERKVYECLQLKRSF
ncbi:YobI family P-loop NTPase [Tannerella forsythia]